MYQGKMRKKEGETMEGWGRGGSPPWPLSMSEGGGLPVSPWVASHAAVARE